MVSTSLEEGPGLQSHSICSPEAPRHVLCPVFLDGLPCGEPLSWGPAPLQEKCTVGPLAPGKWQRVSILPQRTAVGDTRPSPTSTAVCMGTYCIQTQPGCFPATGIVPRNRASSSLSAPHRATRGLLHKPCGHVRGTDSQWPRLVQSSATVSPCHIPAAPLGDADGHREAAARVSRTAHRGQSDCKGHGHTAGSGPRAQSDRADCEPRSI